MPNTKDYELALRHPWRAGQILAGLLCTLLAGCGHPQTDTEGVAGRVTLAASALAQGAQSVCATFTLQPYSLDASGTETLSGRPVTITSIAAGETDAILGCTDGPTDASGDNWGYLVTATSFVDCTTHQSIPGLSPQTVMQNDPIDCQAGVDTPLGINIDVSIPTADQVGYIDISATVDSTVVSVGCKNADVSNGQLHFGEAGFYPEAGNAPYGLTAVGLFNGAGAGVPLAAGALQQFAGIITDGSQDAAYYTGLLTLAQSGRWDVVQTFVEMCPSGQTYLATTAPACDTAIDSGGNVSTVAELADVVEATPGGSWLVAVITGVDTLALASGGSALFSDPNPLAAPAWSAEVAQQTLVLDDAIAGLYRDPSTPGALLAVLTSASGALLLEGISFDPTSGTWKAGPISSLSTLSAAQLDALLQPVVAGCQ